MDGVNLLLNTGRGDEVGWGGQVAAGPFKGLHNGVEQ